MDIVYVSNEGYAQHLAVSLASLFDRNRGERALTAWVVSTGITPESRKKLEDLASVYGREVRFAEAGDLNERFGSRIDTGRFDVSTMGRLFLGELLPGTLRRVLYLDCDTVVLRRLKPLWRTDLGEAAVGAAQEPTIYREVREYLSLPEETPYYNAGVLLIDLDRWRALDLGRRLTEYYAAIAEVSLFNDQDALNGLLRGSFRTIPPKYNFFTNYRYFRYGTLKRLSFPFGEITGEEFREAKRRPAILHFAGDERPWKTGSLNYYGEAYRHYLALTPWRGAKPEKASRVYMLLYHLMGWTTFFFPGIRKRIGERYVKRLIAERAARFAGRGAEGQDTK